MHQRQVTLAEQAGNVYANEFGASQVCCPRELQSLPGTLSATRLAAQPHQYDAVRAVAHWHTLSRGQAG
jgi:hypothetical protein